jgi:uroporphyrinogen decarboxylase
MTAREIITRRINHEGTDITPYDVSFEPELYKRLTEHYKNEHWESGKLRKYSVTYLSVDTVHMQKTNERYSTDAYGALWRMDCKPWHLEKPPLPEPDLAGYAFPSAEIFVEPVLKDKTEAIAKYEADDEHYRIVGMGWGIFEHTWRLRGFENALMDMLSDEDFYREVTEKLTDNYIAMLRACEDVPNDAFLFGDDWGDERRIIMGPEKWRKFIKPCWEKIYAEVHRQGKKAIQHSCGSIVDIYADLVEIGMDCHESVQPEAYGMAPEVLHRDWGKKLNFWGCLGSQSILHNGSPSEIRTEIQRLARIFQKDGGYVLAPAKPLFDEMPIDKAVAVVETLSDLNG